MQSKSSGVCDLLGARVVIFFLTTIERYRSELTLVMNVGHFAQSKLKNNDIAAL